MHILKPSLEDSYAGARGIFIDRWGTLLETPKKGFVTRFSDARFTDGALDAMFLAGQSGWNLYLIGNEPAVAFGELSLEKYETFEADLLSHLRSQGINIVRSYSCTDDPDGIPPNNKQSVFLMPNTGMLYHAAQVDGVALSGSWVIGDSSVELTAGWRASCKIGGVSTGQAVKDGRFRVQTNTHGDSLADVLTEITNGRSANSA